MKPVLHVGIDVGSTTVKIAVLSPYQKLLFGRYVRHMSDIRKATMDLLEEHFRQRRHGARPLHGAPLLSGDPRGDKSGADILS